MFGKSESVNDLQELYITNLRDLYNAEHQITKALPKLADAASSAELKQGFTHHLEQTKWQIDRLETIFKELDEKPGGHTCKAMEGLLQEGDDFVSTVRDPDVLDAALIGAAQKVEHYEISGYGTARAFARLLGYDMQAQLLQQTMEEEAETDTKLSKIADTQINERAVIAQGNASLR